MIKKRNFKSIVATGVIALASATLLAACGSKSTSSKDEINWYTPTEILTLDVSIFGLGDWEFRKQLAPC